MGQVPRQVIWEETETGLLPYIIDDQGERQKVIWSPQSGSQQAVLSCPIGEVLYFGGRGNGKTDALLMDFAQHVGQGFEREWQGVIFRRTFPELDDIILKSQKWFKQIWNEKAASYNKASHTWEWATGEQLRFRHFSEAADYWNYHGQAFTFIGWEELCSWPSPECYLLMMSCLRSSRKKIPLKIRSTTNPSGVGRNWVKARWQLPLLPDKIVGPIIRDSRSQAGDLEPPRVAIQGRLSENKVMLHADPKYLSKIKASASNQTQLDAWVDGSWEGVDGGMFDDVWDMRVHIVPTFPHIPKGWRIDRSFDHGSARPFAIGIWAESNGEPLLYNGKLYGEVKGDTFRIHEWYGWNGQANVGVKMQAGDIAEGLLARIDEWGLVGRVHPGPADTAIFDDYEPTRSVAGDMARKGIEWERADKGPGSRKQGWLQIRKYLTQALPPPGGIPREHPGLFISDCCSQFIRTIPVLPRDTRDLDDVDTNVEDHIGDETRYRLRRKKREFKHGRF